jgi:hypothetical protein
MVASRFFPQPSVDTPLAVDLFFLLFKAVPRILLLCGLTILSGRDCLSADAPKLHTLSKSRAVCFTRRSLTPSGRAAREYKTGPDTFLLKENRK